MKLYEKLPDSVVVNGRKVKLNLDFRNVLRMLDILDRDDLIPEAREWLAVKCVCKHPRKGVYQAVMQLLFPAQSGESKKITDINQDADLIVAAFRQAYGINLYRDELHWFEFSDLLSCIPEGSKYSEVLSIRARPLPAPTKYNAKEREWLMKAKAQFKLKLSEQEAEKQYSDSVKKIGAFLAALAEGSEK